MKHALTYQEPWLPWDDSALHNKILRILIPPLAGLFIAIVLLTQLIEVPKIEHVIRLSPPERLARWLQDSPESPKPAPVPAPVVAAPKPVTPIPIEPKVVAPEPKPPIKQQPMVEKKLPARKLPSASPSKPSARARAEQHASAFNAFSTLTQGNPDQALQVKRSTLKSGTSSQEGESSLHLQPTIAELSNRTVGEKTLTQGGGTATLETSSRTEVSLSALDESSSLAHPSQQTESTPNPTGTDPQPLNERSRSDIQRAFDENKISLDSIYRRALRSNPTIKGTLVLGINIDPSGKVTRIDIASSDLGDTKLESKLMQRVKMINFGAKTVKPWSGQCPIEFFPPAV